MNRMLLQMEQRLFSWDASMGSKFPDSSREWTFGAVSFLLLLARVCLACKRRVGALKFGTS
jgi:hypothetical protein